jgi:hypothetical protein
MATTLLKSKQAPTKDVSSSSNPSEAVNSSQLNMTQTPVLKLDAMVTEADLQDSNEVADILEDVKEESRRFGTVKDVLIPSLGEPG